MPKQFKKKSKESNIRLSKLCRTSPGSKEENKANKKFTMIYGRPSRPLRVGSLFCGIGGFEQALKLLRIKQEIAFACDSA